ncbi:MAG TPA: hypothetical protein PKA38_01950 [Candidatus Levybacteria bacterium]|nr:hypothetical protein [Candidatus Levybacteria bacterium]
MKKKYYSHLVELEVVEQELADLELSSEEKEKLLLHVHSSVEYKVLDVVLSELPEGQKETFLLHMQNGKHDDIWEHLRKYTQEIESKIKNVSQELMGEFIDDIKQIKEKHKK